MNGNTEETREKQELQKEGEQGDALQDALAKVEARASFGARHGNLSDDRAMGDSPFYRKPN